MPRSCGRPCCFHRRSKRRPRHEARLSSRVQRTSPRHGEISQLPLSRHQRNPRIAPTTSCDDSASAGASCITPSLIGSVVPVRASAPASARAASARDRGWEPCASSTPACGSPPRRSFRLQRGASSGRGPSTASSARVASTWSRRCTPTGPSDSPDPRIGAPHRPVGARAPMPFLPSGREPGSPLREDRPSCAYLLAARRHGPTRQPRRGNPNGSRFSRDRPRVLRLR